MHRFKQGAFVLAKEAGVAILPVVLDGTTELVKPNYMFNWHHRLTVKVLPPVSAEEVQGRDTAELMEDVHDRMVAALAEIRADKK